MDLGSAFPGATFSLAAVLRDGSVALGGPTNLHDQEKWGDPCRAGNMCFLVVLLSVGERLCAAKKKG